MKELLPLSLYLVIRKQVIQFQLLHMPFSYFQHKHWMLGHFQPELLQDSNSFPAVSKTLLPYVIHPLPLWKSVYHQLIVPYFLLKQSCNYTVVIYINTISSWLFAKSWQCHNRAIDSHYKACTCRHVDFTNIDGKSTWASKFLCIVRK